MALRSVVGSGRTKLNYYLMNPIYKTHKNVLAGKLGFCHKKHYSTASSSSGIADDDGFSHIHPEVLAALKETKCGNIINVPEARFHKHWINESAQFAVNKHNEDQNGHLEFVRVVEAKMQFVAGRNLFITLEAKDGLVGKLNKYYAEVWVQPWIKFKQLQQWKPVDDTS